MTHESIFDRLKTVSAADAGSRAGMAFKQKGEKQWAACPMHPDRTPSLCVYPDGTWYCFSCNRGGDAVNLYADIYGLTPIDAANKLADDFQIPHNGSSSPTRSAAPTRAQLVKRCKDRRKAELHALNDRITALHAALDRYTPEQSDAPESMFTAGLQRITALQERFDQLDGCWRDADILDYYEKGSDCK